MLAGSVSRQAVLMPVCAVCRWQGQRMEGLAAAAAAAGCAGCAAGVQQPVGVLRAICRALPVRERLRRTRKLAGQHQRARRQGCAYTQTGYSIIHP